MKKLILLMSFGLLILTGCSKEESTDQIEEQSVNSIYTLATSNGESSWESVAFDESLSVSESGNTNRSRGIRAIGRFGGFGLPTTFTGIQNNSGARGRALVQLSGPGGSAARLFVRTSSVVSIGDNEVVYGGIITRVIENSIPPPPPCPTFPNCPPPPPCSPFDLGTYVYFAVKDNGQGNNAPLDQFKGLVIPSCNEFPDGGASFPWFIFPWTDVAQEDRILVLD